MYWLQNNDCRNWGNWNSGLIIHKAKGRYLIIRLDHLLHLLFKMSKKCCKYQSSTVQNPKLFNFQKNYNLLQFQQEIKMFADESSHSHSHTLTIYSIIVSLREMHGKGRDQAQAMHAHTLLRLFLSNLIWFQMKFKLCIKTEEAGANLSLYHRRESPCVRRFQSSAALCWPSFQLRTLLLLLSRGGGTY